MAMSNDFAAALAKLIFQGTAIAGIASNATAAPKDRLYMALHTGNPGAAGKQSVSELAYPEYARVEVMRTAGGWSIVGNVVRPVAPVEFPGMVTNVGGGNVTHFTVGELAAGAGMVYMRGTVTPNLNVGWGDTPRLLNSTTLTLVTDDDGV
ncbi:hypothetical protein H7F35_11455 [Variovorax sp. PAMC26660]|nr:hypothetical protein H7F35_11455 [Variovorax sp. PAMC26660]